MNKDLQKLLSIIIIVIIAIFVVNEFLPYGKKIWEQFFPPSVKEGHARIDCDIDCHTCQRGTTSSPNTGTWGCSGLKCAVCCGGQQWGKTDKSPVGGGWGAQCTPPWTAKRTMTQGTANMIQRGANIARGAADGPNMCMDFAGTSNWWYCDQGAWVNQNEVGAQTQLLQPKFIGGGGGAGK